MPTDLAPVRPGETIAAKSVIAEKHRVIREVVCRVGDTVIIEGDSTMLVPEHPKDIASPVIASLSVL
jgi:3-hydroxybutyryl-CoA dehydratase